MNQKQVAALDAFDDLKPPTSTIRECYAKMPAVRKLIEEAFSTERIDTAPPPTRLYRTGTHTYATLEVSEATFNDVYSRITSAYKHSPSDAEHYFERDSKKVVTKIVLGEVALVRAK